MRPALVLGLLMLLAAQSPSPVAWMKANAVPLTTVVAGNGFADMRPLAKLIGNARIVALGEATHGSREFFQLKHRMLEFLATEMGFTIFSIEANMPEAYRLNDYVLHGTGVPAELLRGMYFWTWDTEEVLAMIEWMRAFNVSGRGRVQFTGFDMQTPTVAAAIVNGFVARHDQSLVGPVSEATKSISAPQPTTSGPAFGLAVGSFPVEAAAGKRIRFSGYIRTEAIADGHAALWWRADGDAGRTLAFDNMQTRAPRGTTDWTRYEIDLAVPADVRNINFGVLMPGRGTAWFDDLAVEIDGAAFVDAKSFDFGFESGVIRGFSTSGMGYQVGIVEGVARTGARSLRITGGAAPATSTGPAPPSPAAVVAAWKDVVSRLEANRAAYRAAGAADRDVEWTIQNARVALQCAQLRAREIGRDRSMAENVKWILDQDPAAKIVLWAHNGHVAAGGFRFETMGSVLRKMYGDRMVVFGFSFNQGSFQAIPQGGGRLKAFTVPPAPADSLDGMLASAGLPLFALDLRKAPEWFGEPHAARQIGSVYPEGQPFAFLSPLAAAEAFDALLFVDTTTAARKNPGR
jgi:erythromycin esterase-like protein